LSRFNDQIPVKEEIPIVDPKDGLPKEFKSLELEMTGVRKSIDRSNRKLIEDLENETDRISESNEPNLIRPYVKISDQNGVDPKVEKKRRKKKDKPEKKVFKFG